jgi:putative ABC transport system permease protein
MFRLLTLRSLLTRPLRMLLSTFGIVLGVAAILAIGMVNQSALDSVTRAFTDASGKANLIVSSAKTDVNGFPARTLRRVEQVPGVALAAPKLEVQTLLVDDAPLTEVGLNFFGTTAGGFTLAGVDPVLDVQVRSYNIVAGRFLSTEPDALEIVLVAPFANERKILLGKSVRIRTADGSALLTVVGLMAKEGPGLQNSGAFGVVPLAVVQKLFAHDAELSAIEIIVQADSSNPNALEEVKGRLLAVLGKDYEVMYPAAQGRRMTQMLGNYQIGLNFLSGIALFVGAFLIYNAFSMSVAERIRQLGMLRTLGMTRRQVAVQVLTEAACLGGVGSLLGIGLGIAMAQGLAGLMGALLGESLSEIHVPPSLVATSAAVGVGVTILATLLPAWQASRTSPMEALRSRGRSNESWLIRNGWWIGLPLLILSAVILVVNPFPYDVQFRIGSIVVFSLFLGAVLVIPSIVSQWGVAMRPLVHFFYGTVGRLGSANIQRSRLRTTLTVAALMVGVAMIIIVQAMTQSFKNDLKAWMEAYIGGDLYVTSSVPMGSRVWNRLQSAEGVAVVAPVRYLEAVWEQANGEEQKLSFMAINPAVHSSVTTLLLSSNEVTLAQAMTRLGSGNSILVSSVLAEKFGLNPGDYIMLRTRSGSRPFQVAAIIVDFYNQGLSITGSWDDMQRYFGVRDASAFLIKVKSGYDAEVVRQSLDAAYGKRDHLIIDANKAIKGRVFNLMDQAFRLFDLLALIAVAVAALGVINTLAMNVMERTQEIGVLRGVGLTRRQVVNMILAEGGVMGIIAGLLGLLLGVVLARIFLMAMTAMSGYRLTFALSPSTIVTALVVGILVSQLAAILQARRAANIRILEAIHYE